VISDAKEAIKYAEEVQPSEQKISKSVKWSDQNHEAIFDKNDPSNSIIIPEKLKIMEEIRLNVG